MASAMCKSAVRVASRTLANRSKSFTTKSSNPFLFSSPSSTNIPRALRILSATGSLESLMPLHSAIANARLTSNIALDSTCWSMLSQELKEFKALVGITSLRASKDLKKHCDGPAGSIQAER